MSITRFSKETLRNLPDSDWGSYKKKVRVRAHRIEGPFEVETMEGVLTCEDGWLALDTSGNPYPIDAAEFVKLYDVED